MLLPRRKNPRSTVWCLINSAVNQERAFLALAQMCRAVNKHRRSSARLRAPRKRQAWGEATAAASVTPGEKIPPGSPGNENGAFEPQSRLAQPRRSTQALISFGQNRSELTCPSTRCLTHGLVLQNALKMCNSSPQQPGPRPFPTPLTKKINQ